MTDRFPLSRFDWQRWKPSIPWVVAALSLALAVGSFLDFRTQRKPSEAMPVAVKPSSTNPFAEINEDFRKNYRSERQFLLGKVPFLVIVESDEVVLIHNGQRTVEKFTPEIYHSLKSVAHIPLNLSLIVHGPDGALTESVAGKLLRAKELIVKHRSLVSTAFPPGAQQDRQLEIMRVSEAFIADLLTSQRLDAAKSQAFVQTAFPLVMRNVDEAAASQLDGLHAVMTRWQQQHGDAFLAGVHVIVMGTQAPRRNNLAIQYFSHLLKLPGECSRLVYSESLFEEAKSIDLLGTRLLDDQVSETFFGNKERMQSDLLMEGAEKHLRTIFR
ncbi:MAG: hypothetical protein ACRC8S_00520 [Fimbriiglobus sp.]